MRDRARATRIAFEPAQRYFDERISWTGSLRPRVYDLDSVKATMFCTRIVPASSARGRTSQSIDALWSGSVVSTRRSGAGTPTNSGEDLDMFLRVLLAGRAIAYESSAVIWHVHRSDSEALGRQMYNYGLGLTAYLAKHMLDSSTRWQMLRQRPRVARSV